MGVLKLDLRVQQSFLHDFIHGFEARENFRLFYELEPTEGIKEVLENLYGASSLFEIPIKTKVSARIVRIEFCDEADG